MRYFTFGYLLQSAGLALIAFSILVDTVVRGYPRFGSVQYAGVIIGVVLILVGLRELLRPNSAVWTRALFAVYFTGIAIFGLSPLPYKVDAARSFLGIRDFSGLDFVINVCGFLPFGYLLASCLTVRAAMPAGGLDRSRFGVVVAAGFATSLVIELVQYWFVPGRYASLIDWLANGFGALLGVSLYGFARRWDAFTCRRSRAHSTRN
jgi:hypothetical protein